MNKNKGSGEDDINPNTAVFLQVASQAAVVAIPILINTYYGDQFTAQLSKIVPTEGFINWLLSGTPTRDYTIITGLMVAVAPAV